MNISFNNHEISDNNKTISTDKWKISQLITNIFINMFLKSTNSVSFYDFLSSDQIYFNYMYVLLQSINHIL